MAVIGNSPNPNDISVFKTVNKQTITGTGDSSYDLSYDVSRAEELEVYVNNVRQEPGVAYTIGSGQITFDEGIDSTDECYIIYQGSRVGTVEPASNTITTAMMTSNAITSDKLHDSINVSTLVTDTLTADSGTIGQVITTHSYSGGSDPAKGGGLVLQGDRPYIVHHDTVTSSKGLWLQGQNGNGHFDVYHRDSADDPNGWDLRLRHYKNKNDTNSKSHSTHIPGGLSVGVAFGSGISLDEGRYITGWYQSPNLSSSSGSTYYLETNLWGGGSPHGNTEYIMGGFIIKGYRYASTNVCEARIMYHNWSGSFYNSNTVQHFGNWQPSISMTNSTDGYNTLQLGVYNSYCNYRIDFWQASTYPMRDVGLRSEGFSSP